MNRRINERMISMHVPRVVCPSLPKLHVQAHEHWHGHVDLLSVVLVRPYRDAQDRLLCERQELPCTYAS